MIFRMFSELFWSSKHFFAKFTLKFFLRMQQFMIIKVPLLGKLFTAFFAKEGICVKFFMNSKNVFSKEFLWAKRAVKVPLSGLVDGNVSHQFGFCFKAFTAEIAKFSSGVWMLRNYVL